jgi:hypothetical protein
VNNIKTYDDDYSASDGVLVAIYLRADKTYDNYERKVTDILTLLGDLGGLQEFFLLVGGLLVGFITQKMFMASIIKKTYHIRKYDNIEDEMKKRNNNGDVLDIDEEKQTDRAKIYPISEV